MPLQICSSALVRLTLTKIGQRHDAVCSPIAELPMEVELVTVLVLSLIKINIKDGGSKKERRWTEFEIFRVS